MSDELMGYRGRTRDLLSAAGLRVGDLVKVVKGEDLFEGTLMPRYELADDRHIVVKLESGYNVGVEIAPEIAVERVGAGAKPTFLPTSPPPVQADLPDVVIISTGGTIASRIDYQTGGVRPALSASDLFSCVPELADIANVHTEILFSLLSENVHVPHWVKLAERISAHVASGARGVVISHGTDTMAYTAAALSFALHDLPVPVILVGSQRSSDRPSSDAVLNLVNAVRAASQVDVAEVMIGMHATVADTETVLHRGTKVRKCHTSRRDAFRSVNATPIARVSPDGITVLTRDYTRRDPARRLVLKPTFEERVALLKFHPGLHAGLVDFFVDHEYRGIVLEGTGLGHVGEYLFPDVQRAVDAGLVVCMTSQCLWGRVNMNVYQTGRHLQRMGVLPLGDMLPETALVKLMWSLGQTSEPRAVRRLMVVNVAREVTSRTAYEEGGDWPSTMNASG